jgi:hypothetical protein
MNDVLLGDENISYCINEDECDKPEVDPSIFLSCVVDEDLEMDVIASKTLNYQLNFTIRQLTQICDYYAISKSSKCTKDEIINIIIDFENNPENAETVSRRKNMWFYINELKQDKYMKKYIMLW